VRDITATHLKRYFTQEGENYRIVSEIRKMIVFSYHDILRDPPFSRMDLVACRNMLIYISAEAQKEIIRKIHFSLNINGYLFLGPSEHIGYTLHSMQEVDKKWRIYKNIAKARNDGDGLFSPLEPGSSLKAAALKVKNPFHHIAEIFSDTMLEEYSFAGILVDTNLEVKQATGNYKKFLDLPEKGFNFNIMKLVPADLGIPLNVALRRAIKENVTVSMKRVKVKAGKEERNVSFIVKPYLKVKEYAQPFLFVILSDDPRGAAGAAPADGDKHELQSINQVEELEEELKETKQNLQAVIEEIEAANEELQSTNEEMVSTNEELQSTNEELQSLNEELHTVSSEHQLKIRELMDLNDDMNNYFRNSDIGQILIDRNLIIRKFSPAVTKMVNLIESDVNRSILDITTRFNQEDFTRNIKLVSNTGKPVKEEIRLGQETYLMRITPYLRQDNSRDGVVVNFIDVTETRKLNNLLTAVLDSSPSSISAMKAVRNKNSEIVDFEFITANAALEKEMGVARGTLTGKTLNEISPDDQNFNLYKEVTESGKTKQLEQQNTKSGKWYDLVLEKLMDGIVCISTEVTDKKKAIELIAKGYDELMETSKKLRNTNLKLEQSNMDLLQFASVASHDLKEPLRKIQTFGNLLLSKTQGKLEPTELGHLEKMVSASGRMQRLIEDVLTLSKLSNSEKTYEEGNLNEVLNLIKDDLEISTKEKNAEIIIKKLPKVKGISGQMHQIFQNLISNALKFTNGKKPEVIIEEKKVSKSHAEELKIRPEDFTCISVKDNGIGFESAYKDKIFGIFQRLNGGNYDGTGIGLAICKKIMENHNGHITVESEPSKGAEFFIFLPKK
jgi:two-component system CheB/CheR fusion protein